jgi:ABC-type arginine transport system permease subunit
MHENDKRLLTRNYPLMLGLVSLACYLAVFVLRVYVCSLLVAGIILGFVSFVFGIKNFIRYRNFISFYIVILIGLLWIITFILFFYSMTHTYAQ